MSAFLRKYGAAATLNFDLFEVDGVDFRVDAVHASGDTKIMKDEGAEANTTNGFTDEGSGYSIVLTATEMQAARIVIYAVDQTATKVWLDRTVVIETYGNASAQHAMDFDDAVRGGMTALPNANVNDAGGLVTSAGGATGIDDLATAASISALNDVAATDIVTAGAITTASGAVVNVTNVSVTTTNSDMVGTNNALLAASINLTAGAVDNVTTVANVSGAVGSVTGNVDGNVTGSVGTLTGQTPQTGDSYLLLTGAQAEPTGVPAANETPLEKLAYVFAALRNKVTVTATKKQFFDDADAAMWEKDLSDDSVTYQETKANLP